MPSFAQQPKAAQQTASAKSTMPPRAHLIAAAPHRPHSPAIQTKLAIGAPGDRFEREADAVADQVMRMPDPALQRQCNVCAKVSGANEDEKPRIQRLAK